MLGSLFLHSGGKRGSGTSDAILFVDGNNLYHNVRAMGVRPGDIDFGKLTDFICSEFRCNKKEVHYYNSIPDISDGKDKYYSHMKFLDDLKKIKGFVVKTRKLQKQSNEKEINERIRAIDEENFCSKCGPLVEKLCTDCVGRFSKKEKGIDVWIAIDMLNLGVIQNEYDMCLLVSGDADFIPALDIVKSKGKEAASAFVWHGYSYDLRQKHRYKIIGEKELDGLLRTDF